MNATSNDAGSLGRIDAVVCMEMCLLIEKVNIYILQLSLGGHLYL